MKNILQKLFIFLIIFEFIFLAKEVQANLSDSLSGRILLQIEDNGEAWYLNPGNKQRYFLGRPADAFALMREQGIGATNENLLKIPIADNQAFKNVFEKIDSDGDNYNDYTELINGYNPYGEGRISYDLGFTKKMAGKIFLQVEKKGEAWYLNPLDLKRYFLGRPADAFEIMRQLGLGISNANLAKIPTISPIEPTIEECNSWTYSNWSDCLPSGQQTRTIVSSLPLNCIGGNPSLIQACNFETKDFSCGDSVFYEGQEYPSTKINNQCWLAKNLNVGKMIDDKERQEDNNIIEKYCHDNNEANCDIYGGMYQWAEAVQYKNSVSNFSGSLTTNKVQGICPSGWHLPSNNEWASLEQYLATDTCGSKNLDWQCSPSGKRLKSSRTALGPNGEKVGIATDNEPRWPYDAENYGIDDLGFSALPNGMTRNGRISFAPNYNSWFWSSTTYSPKQAWYFILEASKSSSYRFGGNIYYQKSNGLALRCLKD